MERRAFLGSPLTGLLASGAGCVGFGSSGGEASSVRSEATTTMGSTAMTTGEGWSVEPVSLPMRDEALYRAAPRDAIPAIVDPEFGSDWGDVEYEIEDRDGGSFVPFPDLSVDEAVLGVAVDGAVRAYPLTLLDWHEVVNDDFGGATVVTYCPVCRSGVVADRDVAGAVRTFGVTGLLFRANLVLYDDASESLWSQLQAQAIQGDLAGTRLDVLSSTVTTWGAWRKNHPETDVLLPLPFSGTVLGEVRYNYEIDVSERVRDITQRYPDYGPLDWGDARLRRRAVVVGVEHDGVARAHPLSAVEHDGSVNDAVAGKPVVGTPARAASCERAAFGGGWRPGRHSTARRRGDGSSPQHLGLNCTGRRGCSSIRTRPCTGSTDRVRAVTWDCAVRSAARRAFV